MKLPNFQRTAKQRKQVEDQLRTARFIRALWAAAPQTVRHDPTFVSLLVQSAWTNVGKGTGLESTRKWRNLKLAEYSRVRYESDRQLAQALCRKLPALTKPLKLVRSHTGITRYYGSLRGVTITFVHKHSGAIARAFELVSSRRIPAINKVRRVVDSIAGLGEISVNGKKVSPLNGLTPALACLDPLRKFPIMNRRTQRLLKAIGERQDSEGAVTLSKLIGLYGVKNSFDLDVYSQTEDFSKVERRIPRTRQSQEEYRDLGLKSELSSFARIVANRIRIRRLHNRLTRRLRDYLLWRHITAKEDRFDALVQNWRPGRHLLIEAKTTAVGPSGRAQIRQAIGQLFDYRFSYFKTHEKVDLAVLLPSEPPANVRSLLSSLGIELLWFERRQLRGSISL